MSESWIKQIKLIFTCATPIAGIFLTVATLLFPNFFTTEVSVAVTLALLSGLAITVSTREYEDRENWKDIETHLDQKLDSVSNCRIQTFDTTVEWVDAINSLIKTGRHNISHASLDSSTRNKAPGQHNAIWEHILAACKNKDITYNHLIRVRANNFENLLDRIIAGNAANEAYFAYYELPQSFPFATFEVIDARYVATRSPFVQGEGEKPCYMIIDNVEIAAYFLRYFKRLWLGAKTIENSSVINEFYTKFSPSYSDEVRTRIEEKIEQLKEAGIMNDI